MSDKGGGRTSMSRITTTMLNATATETQRMTKRKLGSGYGSGGGGEYLRAICIVDVAVFAVDNKLPA